MRISLTEYGDGISLSDVLEDAYSHQRIFSLVSEANSKIQKNLNTSRRVLAITDGRLRALGIAGTIRLAKNIEIEIAPKLFTNDDNRSWKESLFLLAALSKYGSIIASERIHSSVSYKDSLYDIAGRILADEYRALKRKPIRRYRRESFADFAIDGEIDFSSVFEKNPDGLVQERIVFDKHNGFNSTISRAMSIVLPYIKDNSIKTVLQNAIQEFGTQSTPSHQRLCVPPRNKEWKNIYNLSYDIVSGMGSSLEAGEIMSPSFIVDTWRIWEWLVTVGIKVGLGNNYAVIPQKAIHWGTKTAGVINSRINVYPDIAIYPRNNLETPAFLIDAKYKVLDNSTSSDIDRSDLYEAYAFCNATGCNTLVLAYPEVANSLDDIGNCTVIFRYQIRDVVIMAAKVSFGSVSKSGDIAAFCRSMATNILAVTENNHIYKI